MSDIPAVGDTGTAPAWLDGVGAAAVVTALSWLLATRTAGRALVSAGLALVLAVASLLVGGRVLPTGAAVMTCVVGSVYAVMVTVPAVTGWKAMREALIAVLVAAVTAFAAVGFEPTVAVERFEIVTLLLALGLVLAIVYRLGAGLHGLGRRGMIVVAIGLGVLFATLAYAELLRRYGAQSFVSSVLDFADWTSARIGAFPRPLVVLLGIPALVWGTHVRARRRQGWWFCAFGVAATVPLATGLVSPDTSYLEAGLRAAYSLVLGLLIGWLVIRADLAADRAEGSRRTSCRGGRTAPARAASLRRALTRLRVGAAISGYARVTASVGAMARPTSLEIVSELVANVLTIEVAEGDRVEAGDTVVLLESMKMEIPMLAERAGTVTAIKVTAGDVVQDGDVLVVLD